MKKLSRNLCAFLVLCLSSVAAVAQPKSLAIVQGSVADKDVTKVSVFRAFEGDYQLVAAQQVKPGGAFAIAIPDGEQGFYYIGINNRRIYVRVYLMPNDRMTLTLDAKLKPTFVKGSPEAKLAMEWNTISYDYVRRGYLESKDTMTYRSFFPLIYQTEKQSKSFLAKVKTNNSRFNSLMKMAVKMDMENTALGFVMLPNSIHPQRTDYPEFYKRMLVSPKFTDASVLQLAEAKRFISMYPFNYYRFTLSDSAMRTFYEANKKNLVGAELFQNDTLKGLLVMNKIPSYRTFDDLEANIAPFRQYLVTDSMQAFYDAALRSVANFKKGSTAYNFNYEDTTGKKVSLASLKGKVVLVDMWATWCGPCKQEIPHLKKLEEEVKGTNVAIVSISVDELEDKQKWKDFIAKEKLGGIQLFAAGWSEMTRFYQIKGIPRFLVFDTEGKIVTVDAPRPSTPELKKLLLQTAGGVTAPAAP